MKYNFDEPIERKGTYSLKWDAGELLKTFKLTERVDEDTIPVFVADMDFQSPQPVLDALHRVIDTHRIFGYSSHQCAPDYLTALKRWFKTRRNWEIHDEEVIYVNGTVEAVRIAILAFTAPGDGVIIQPPVYTPFSGQVHETGRVVVNNRLINQDGYYLMDFADLEQKAQDPNTKLLILCHPHNPVGRVWTPDELRQLAEICQRNHVLVVADEIHGDILRKGQQFFPLATVAGGGNLVSLTAINKTFNLAGLQCTNAIIADPELRAKFSAACGFKLPTPFAISALIAAYNEGEEWLEQVNDYIDGNIDWIMNFLKEKMPLVKCFRPEGTYILWLDFRSYGLSAAEIHQRIYNRANVILEGGAQFDPEGGVGFERICIPARRALIQEVFERIAREF